MSAARVIPVLIAAALAGATGCGDGSRDDAPTPAGLAQRTGCSQLAASDTDEVGVLERGRCFIDSHPVVFSTFSNNEIRDLWLRGAQDAGGSYVVGDRFVGHTGSPGVAAVLAESLEAVTVQRPSAM